MIPALHRHYPSLFPISAHHSLRGPPPFLNQPKLFFLFIFLRPASVRVPGSQRLRRSRPWPPVALLARPPIHSVRTATPLAAHNAQSLSSGLTSFSSSSPICPIGTDTHLLRLSHIIIFVRRSPCPTRLHILFLDTLQNCYSYRRSPAACFSHIHTCSRSQRVYTEFGNKHPCRPA